MKRSSHRQALAVAAALIVLISDSASGAPHPEGTIMTVRGPIPPGNWGRVLTHEHIAGSFTHVDQISYRYEVNDVVAAKLPLILAARERGFTGLVETTPVDLSRAVDVLLAIAERADLHILTNTGNYGAFGDALTLQYVFDESADQLAARWTGEFRNGIDDTGIKPGFIKTAVDPGPLSAVDRKLVQAAARAHLQTGLTINVHTGEAVAAQEVLATVMAERVHPSALVIVHADRIADHDVLRQLAAAGAWISFDQVDNVLNPNTVAQLAQLIRSMIAAGYLEQLLISHDTGWWNVAMPDGTTAFAGRVFPPTTPDQYQAVADRLFPELRRIGITEAQIDQLTIANPARAFTVRVRARS